jgi:hypothetical protein
VSAIETFKRFKENNLQVVVDVAIAGARINNYQASAKYNDQSAVEAAIRQMRAAGVQVVRQVLWA